LVAVGQEWIGLVAGIVLFAAAFIGSVVLSFQMMSGHKCPECGMPLQPPKGWWIRMPGEPLLLHCATCEVDWDLDLRGHQD
jgi:hypothetical protein